MALRPALRARLQAGLACLGAAVLCWRLPSAVTATVLAVALALLLLACFAPAAYAPVQRRLDAFTRALLGALSWCVLGLVYFGMFTPLRGLWWLAGRSPLPLARDSSRSTYLEPLGPGATGRFDRQF